MNKEKLEKLNNIILDYENNVSDKANVLLDEKDLEILFHENDKEILLKEDSKINNLYLKKNEIIEILNQLFYDTNVIIDLNSIKKEKMSENTFNIIYKYLFDNNYTLSENLSLINTNSENLFFKDLKNYPRLSNEEQKECLNKNSEYLKKEDDCINYIITYYIDLIEKCAKKYSNTDLEYNSIKQYLIKYIIQLINSNTIFFDKKKMDEIIDSKIKNSIQNRINYYSIKEKLERNYQFDKYIINEKPTKKGVINKYKKYLEYEKERINIKKYIVEHNLRFVVSIAKQYLNKGLSLSDLIQEGSIGLMRALDSYDPEIASFTTYATWWTKQAMSRALENTVKQIRIPVHFNEKFTKYKVFYTKYINQYGEKPNINLIKQELNLTDNEINEFGYLILNQVSLNETVGDESKDSDELGDFIEDKSVNVEKEALNLKIKNDVFNILQILPKDQMAILFMRFGITLDNPIIVEHKNLIILLTSNISINENNVNNYLIKNGYYHLINKINNNVYRFKIVYLKGYPMTLEQVGEIFKVTRERIRQKEAIALKKLRTPTLKKKLDLLDY